MKEIVIISGKGGTGKTSITAAFSFLADHPVIADCDVDAADMHLLLQPKIQEQHDFISGHEAIIRNKTCIGCGRCLEVCKFDAVKKTETSSGDIRFDIDSNACEGCGVCVQFCPVKAIDFPDRNCGVWMKSMTRVGPLVHAKLGTASENSGKLVSLVRKEARNIAEKGNYDFLFVDGPPGIGCPVIASVTGADAVVAVTEPTVSGRHDLKRVADLAKHFKIKLFVCINKWDVNPEMTNTIEEESLKAGGIILGRISYDKTFTQAQLQGKSIIETENQKLKSEIQGVWKKLCTNMTMNK